MLPGVRVTSTSDSKRSEPQLPSGVVGAQNLPTSHSPLIPPAAIAPPPPPIGGRGCIWFGLPNSPPPCDAEPLPPAPATRPPRLGPLGTRGPLPLSPLSPAQPQIASAISPPHHERVTIP